MALHFLLTKKARDYTLEDVNKMSELEVVQFFAQLRWGNDGRQTCPKCGTINRHQFVRVRRQWRCKDCGHTFSVTSGTILADHKLPLKILLQAVLLFVVQVKGVSACQMSRVLGVTYKTAFTLLHKLREALVAQRDASPLKDHVQVDGGHFSGRRRKPRKKPEKQYDPLRKKTPPSFPPFHRNRRIIMVLREVYPEKGTGARRTIVSIAMGENEEAALGLARRYIEKDALVMTDESPAYASYAALFDHKTVNHSMEFSTDEGVNNNQAESYFTRARRMVLGQLHRITPKYMFDYANEIAWREDNRRRSTGEQLKDLLKKALSTGTSQWWFRYWQGNNRPGEILMA